MTAVARRPGSGEPGLDQQLRHLSVGVAAIQGPGLFIHLRAVTDHPLVEEVELAVAVAAEATMNDAVSTWPGARLKELGDILATHPLGIVPLSVKLLAGQASLSRFVTETV